MKRKTAILSASLIFVFTGLIVLSSRDSLARLAWQKYHWPQMAILLDRSDADLAMFIGDYYFNGVTGSREYNPDISFKAYKKAVSIKSEILWGHYQLARIYFLKGDFNGALEEIKKELTANPENLRSLYVRGLIYGYRNQSGDLEKAEADYRRFTEWVPTEWAGYNDLAWILSKENKFEDVKKVISTALVAAYYGDDNPWLWNSLGVAQLNLAENRDAAISFKKALTLAEKLTAADWVKSYPGNDPQAAFGGLAAFRNAIQENLERARGVHNL